MERTILINANGEDIEIQVKATMATLRLYRAEFGTDLIKDLTAVHEQLHPDPFSDAMRKARIDITAASQEELYSAILANVDFTKIDENGDGFVEIPDGATQMTVMQVLWAMAKTAAGSTKRFDLWCDDFDVLPIRNIADLCFEIWRQANTGTVELKN